MSTALKLAAPLYICPTESFMPPPYDHQTLEALVGRLADGELASTTLVGVIGDQELLLVVAAALRPHLEDFVAAAEFYQAWRGLSLADTACAVLAGTAPVLAVVAPERNRLYLVSRARYETALAWQVAAGADQNPQVSGETLARWTSLLHTSQTLIQACLFGGTGVPSLPLFALTERHPAAAAWRDEHRLCRLNSACRAIAPELDELEYRLPGFLRNLALSEAAGEQISYSSAHSTWSWALLDDADAAEYQRNAWNPRAVDVARRKLLPADLQTRLAPCMDKRWSSITRVTLKPEWHSLPDTLLARLYGGETPVACSGNLLTRAEAHRWLYGILDRARSSRASRESRPENKPWYGLDPFLYLCHAEFGLPLQFAEAVSHCARERIIAEWLRRPAALRFLGAGPRELLPGRRYSGCDFLALLRARDLPQGARTSPARVAECIRTRLLTIAVAVRSGAPLAQAAITAPDARVQPLTAVTELLLEAELQGNCLDGYGERCMAGQAFIFRVVGPEQVSTLELQPMASGYQVHQHEGPRRARPAPANQSIVAAWCAANRIRPG